MMNLQDELAWLNHHLDRKLEEWWKLHRLHGMILELLTYSLLILLIIFCIILQVEGGKLPTPHRFLFFLIPGVVLIFFSHHHKRNCYQNLLELGDDIKKNIYSSRIYSNLGQEKLVEYQGKLVECLQKERKSSLLDACCLGICNAFPKTITFSMGILNKIKKNITRSKKIICKYLVSRQDKKLKLLESRLNELQSKHDESKLEINELRAQIHNIQSKFVGYSSIREIPLFTLGGNSSWNF